MSFKAFSTIPYQQQPQTTSETPIYTFFKLLAIQPRISTTQPEASFPLSRPFYSLRLARKYR